jgi:hypothetical protein
MIDPRARSARLARIRRRLWKARCVTCAAPCAGSATDEVAFCVDCLDRPDEAIRRFYEELGTVD